MPSTVNNKDRPSPVTLQEMLAAAISHHQGGRLTDADKIYRQMLEADPNNIDALHLLGLISIQTGDPTAAIELIGNALKIKEDVPQFHYNIGNACAVLNKTDEAITHYERAIELQPNNAEAHNNLGYIFLQLKNPHLAAGCLTKALKIRPEYADAHNNLGLAHKDMGALNEALKCFKRAITLAPDYLAARNNLGMVLRTMGRPDEASPHFEHALARNPNYAEARNNLGNALRDMGKLDEAQAEYERALSINPEYAEAHSNLGNIYKDKSMFGEAIASYERALSLKPDFATACFNIGTVYQETGRHNEAMDYYERTLKLDPGYGDALWNQSLLYLLKGDFDKGWKQYERRWVKLGPHGFNKPLWDGSDLTGKTILLHCEQGLGDSLQFIPYAALVKQRGGKVLLACPKPLTRILETAPGIDQLITEGQPLPDYDCQSPLVSLPLIFNTDLDTIPANVPYLAAPPDQTAAWAERLKSCKGKKVGLVWAGNPRKYHAESNAVDRRRSMRLEQFAPLAEIPGIDFISLQKDGPAEQAINPPPGMNLIDFMDEVSDFTDTAAIIANLDLVIGVDTSVVHLAGALAKPVWMLSRFDGCWRWLLDRSDSPWYPTMRIFRQPKAGDWTSVVENVRAALKDPPDTHRSA